jgi:8-oxo-(d)GTP phosphatase
VAAGGLVVRSDVDGISRVLVVHRPRYDDWSLPKGKSEPGEPLEHTAVREVEEETGVRADVIAPLAEIEYEIGAGIRKIVQYFTMRLHSESDFAPNDEVDEIRWLTPAHALALLTYEHDRWLVSSQFDPTTGIVWLVRHAAAGDRYAWTDDDQERPLTKKGIRQAEAIAASLAKHDVDSIHSSPFVRCRETVEPLAVMIGQDVRESEHLAEGARPSRTLEWIAAQAGRRVVACSHGDVIPGVVRQLGATGVPLHSPNGVFDVKKASIWTLALEGNRVVSATYTAPPDV